MQKTNPKRSQQQPRRQRHQQEEEEEKLELGQALWSGRAPRSSHSLSHQLRRKVAERPRCPLSSSRSQTHSSPARPERCSFAKVSAGDLALFPLDFRTILG